MASDTIGEGLTEEDSDLCSWSSAFDPKPVRPSKSSQKKKKDKKTKKKKKTKSRQKSKKKETELFMSEDSDEILAAGRVGSLEQSNSGNGASALAESLQPAERALPDIEDMGEYVFLAVWQPTAPPPRLNRTRACAKLLVRSGLRCPCHFRHVNSCPNRATSSPAPQLLLCSELELSLVWRLPGLHTHRVVICQAGPLRAKGSFRRSRKKTAAQSVLRIVIGCLPASGQGS